MYGEGNSGGLPAERRTVLVQRGENADPRRRTELHLALRAQAAASAKAAKLTIDQQSVALQEKVIVGGLMSVEAKDFLKSLPTPEELMPSLQLPKLN